MPLKLTMIEDISQWCAKEEELANTRASARSHFFGYDGSGEVRYLQHIRLALREMKSNRPLLCLLVYLLGISVLWDLEEFDQLYYQLAGLPIWAFGIVSFAGSSFSALGARAAHRMKRDHTG